MEKLFGVFVIFMFYIHSYAQDDPNRYIQFSGLILDIDSLTPLSFAHVFNKTKRIATFADIHGFFSFVAEKGDLIEFTHVGYKKAQYKIPTNLHETKFTLFQLMTKDTIWLPETVIYPWPSPDQFKNAFLYTVPPEDDYDRAMKNLALQELKERLPNLSPGADETYKYRVNQITQKLYYAGQLPPNNLINPLAWMQFIQAWKNGAFKKQKNSSKEYFYNEPLY